MKDDQMLIREARRAALGVFDPPKVNVSNGFRIPSEAGPYRDRGEWIWSVLFPWREDFAKVRLAVKEGTSGPVLATAYYSQRKAPIVEFSIDAENLGAGLLRVKMEMELRR
jgi:hypothetical protein